jgi:acyl-CoA hydrolase
MGEEFFEFRFGEMVTAFGWAAVVGRASMPINNSVGKLETR